jgi:hypothetical protein
MFHDSFNLKNVTILKAKPKYWHKKHQMLTYNAILGATQRTNINFASVLGMWLI